jgi:DNA-binding CsgD family transcriptional regulator
MNFEKARWSLSQNDIGHLSAALKPIRTSREVAEILGVSTTLVCQLENSALRKIVRALRALEAEGGLERREEHELAGTGMTNDEILMTND